MNWALIVANVGVMIWEKTHADFMIRYELHVHSLHVTRFISYAFLHVGWSHLFFNMLMLYILGNNINDRLGQVGYLGFYLGGAVFAGIGFLALGGQAMVGASGAVGAVMGAYLVLLPTANISLNAIVVTLEVPSMYFVIVFFLYNVVMSLASRLGAPTVAYEAHIAGMLFGFAVALAMLVVRLLPRHPSDLLGLVQRRGRTGTAN